ncbi:hypothetical protein [Pseudomonas sp. Y3 TE3536]
MNNFFAGETALFQVSHAFPQRVDLKDASSQELAANTDCHPRPFMDVIDRDLVLQSCCAIL